MKVQQQKEAEAAKAKAKAEAEAKAKAKAMTKKPERIDYQMAKSESTNKVQESDDPRKNRIDYTVVL